LFAALPKGEFAKVLVEGQNHPLLVDRLLQNDGV